MNKINFINGQAGGTPLSAENLNQMQTNIENAINLNTEDIENLQKNTLWTNPDPQSFSSQSINLSSSDYDYLIIYSYRNKTLDNRTITTIVEKNKDATILYMDYLTNATRVFYREVSVANSTVTIGDCYINSALNNSILVPYKIMGCKY